MKSRNRQKLTIAALLSPSRPSKVVIDHTVILNKNCVAKKLTACLGYKGVIDFNLGYY